MAKIRIESAEYPWSGAPVAAEGAALLGRAEAMGLLDAVEKPISRLDTGGFQLVLDILHDRGLVQRVWIQERESHPSPGEAAFPVALGAGSGKSSALLDAIRRAYGALEASAVPADEWRHQRRLLGDDLLAELCGVSAPSLRRYASATRATPDPVADRLHAITLIVADLSGAYNDYGIRRWFRRPRTQLDGLAPIEIMRDDWSPDDDQVVSVRQLARAIVSSPAT